MCTVVTIARVQFVSKSLIPREQFSRSILVANVTWMSLTCQEEIERVGRVGRGCYEETAAVKFRLNRKLKAAAAEGKERAR